LAGPRRTRKARCEGDERSINGIICDTFIARLTGTDPAERARVEIGVVVSAATWLGAGDTPARLPGYGAIRPSVVREIVDGSDTWVHRVLVDPIDSEVLAIDSRARQG
jgi:hypothetical protein